MLGVGLLYVLEHEGVVAKLPQLHNGVHELLALGAALALFVLLQHDTLLGQIGVERPLEAGHFAFDDVLDL